MTSWNKIIPISVLLLCFVIAVPVEGAITATTPSYSSGDYWNYGDVGASTEDMKLSVGSTSATFNGVSCIEQKAQIYSSGMWINTTMYYRASDGANVGSYLEMTVSGSTMKVTTIAKPATPQYSYPLVVGKKWNTHYIMQTTTEMTIYGMNLKTTTNSTYDWNFTVASEETVTVAAGTFDTLKITSSSGGGSVSTSWYSPKAGTFVKSESTSGGSTSTTELKSYQFKNAPSGGGGGNDNGGLFSGMMLYIIILVIIIVVIVVIVAVMMKKKKAQPAAPGMAPVQPGMQPAQPIAPGQPQAPPQQYQPPQYQPPQAQQPQYQPPEQAQQYQQPAQPAYDQTQPYQQQYAPPPQAPQQYPPQPPQ